MQITQFCPHTSGFDTDSQIKLMQCVLLNILQWYISIPSAQGQLAIKGLETILMENHYSHNVVFFSLLFIETSSTCLCIRSGVDR